MKERRKGRKRLTCWRTVILQRIRWYANKISYTDYIVIAAGIIYVICKYTFNCYFLLIIFITNACPVSWSFVSSRYCLQTCNMHSSSQQQVVYMSKFITKKKFQYDWVELKSLKRIFFRDCELLWFTQESFLQETCQANNTFCRFPGPKWFQVFQVTWHSSSW